MVDINFEDRVEGVLQHLCKILYKSGKNAMTLGEWGMKEDMIKDLDKLRDMGMLFLYMLMEEYKTYEQNTFHLLVDGSDCPIIKHPSQVADADMVECLCNYFDCKWNMDITKILQAFLIYPLGQAPDGVSFDSVDDAIDDCDDDNILEVYKS